MPRITVGGAIVDAVCGALASWIRAARSVEDRRVVPAYQPSSFKAQPAFQILVMWRIFPPSKSIE
jgi:hypothetical protein